MSLKRFVTVFLTIVFISFDVLGQTSKSCLYLIGLEGMTKYVWRGQEYGNAPILFPNASVTYKAVSLGITGGYCVNGSHSEVDISICYQYA